MIKQSKHWRFKVVRKNAQSNDVAVEARCWMAHSDIPWHQLPAEYGKGNSVYPLCRLA